MGHALSCAVPGCSLVPKMLVVATPLHARPHPPFAIGKSSEIDPIQFCSVVDSYLHQKCDIPLVTAHRSALSESSTPIHLDFMPSAGQRDFM
jgi:hypothetical protein